MYYRITLVALCAFALAACTNEPTPEESAITATIERSGSPLPAAIAPIIQERCERCHIEESRGQFSMATLESALEGGKSGAVIIPGDSANSRLYQLVAGLVEDKRMPPKGDPLTEDQVTAIQAWIDAGAS